MKGPVNQITVEQFLERGQVGAKAAHRVIGGVRAQGSGKDFEKSLGAVHQVYEQMGMAQVEQLPVNTRPMPPAWLNAGMRQRSGVCRILAERARFDYYGALGPKLGSDLVGRAVAMEAKNTTTREASLRIVPSDGDGSGSGLKEHQLAACAVAWSTFATLAVVVWRNGEERLLFAPDFLVAAFQEFRLKQRTRIYPKEATHWLTRELGGLHRAEDWLTPAVAWFDASRRRP